MPTITENDTMMKILNKYGISEFEDFTSSEAIKVFKMFKDLYKKYRSHIVQTKTWQ